VPPLRSRTVERDAPGTRLIRVVWVTAVAAMLLASEAAASVGPLVVATSSTGVSLSSTMDATRTLARCKGEKCPRKECPGKRCRPKVGPRPGIKCPSGSIRLRPGRDLQAAINAKSEGTTFCFKEGTYRLRTPLLPKSHDVFVGEYGAVLRGSKVIRKWRKEGRFWVATGQTQENEVVPGVTCQAGIECNRPEGVFINDRPLLQVTSLEAVGRGSFFFDYANDKIYMANDPKRRKVEVSVAAGAFRSTAHYAEGVVIKNLVIEKFANPSRTGAIYDSVSPGWVVANSEVALNHGVGIAHYNGATIRKNDIHHNGQLGLSGYQSVGALVQGNEIAWNAIGGFAGWEAGGAKYGVTVDLTVRNNYVHHNQHHGLWTNFDNVQTVYENNTVVANKGSGIMHEEAFDCIIRGNYLARNGVHGIFISSSSDVDAYGNTLEANGFAGVQLFIDGATGYDLANNHIHDNLFKMREGTYNGLTTTRVSDPVPYLTSKSNRFQSNSYLVPNVSGRYWTWGSSLKTWSEWQAAGQDTTGSVQQGAS
jgi:parallel beta-helix repeat protein